MRAEIRLLPDPEMVTGAVPMLRLPAIVAGDGSVLTPFTVIFPAIVSVPVPVVTSEPRGGFAPEESTSGEIGLRWRVAAQQFSIAGFHQRIDDLIDYPAPAFTATNIAHALNQGLELGWSWRTATTQLEAQATQQHPVDADTGTALARRPDKQFAASARQHVGNAVELRAGLRAMGPRPNSPYDNVVLPGFAVIDLGAAWTLQPGLVLDARVENVGDTRYMLASGSTGNFLMPDRAYFVGIDWHFDRVRNK